MIIGLGISPNIPRKSGPGVILPSDIAGLEAWYDATIAGSITVATGVSAWAPQVGSLTVAQATASRQPANGSTIGSKNAFLFDGTDDSLSGPDGVGTAYNWTTDKLSIFAVIQTPASFSGTTCIASKANNPDTANDGTKWSLKVNSTGKLTGEITTSTITEAVSTWSLSTSTRYVVGMVYDGANIKLLTNAHAAENTAKAGNLMSNISCAFRVGLAKYEQEWWRGRLGEVCLYSTAVSGSNLTGLIDGLVAKWT